MSMSIEVIQACRWYLAASLHASFEGFIDDAIGHSAGQLLIAPVN